MKTHAPSRIAARYRRVLAVFVVAVGLVFALAQSVIAYRSSESAAIALQESELQAVVSTIDGQLTTLLASVTQACRIPWSSGLLGVDEQRVELRRLLRRNAEIVEAGIAGPDGRESAFVSRVSLDRVGSGRPVGPMGPPTDGVRVGEVFFRDGLAPHVRLECFDRKAQGGAMTFAEVNLEFTSEAVAKAARRLAGDAFVLDGQGRLVAHSRPALVHSSGRETVPAEGAGTRSRWTGSFLDARLLSATGLETVPWRLGVSQKATTVLAPAAWLVGSTLVAVFLTLLIAVAVAYLLAARLSNPIRQLGRGVASLAAGDLSQRVDVRSGDEIEDVAREFNRMAAQLQEYTAGLEKKVAERTAALEAALRARALFLAAASHDLRQPLYAISLLADTLSSEPLDESSATILAKQREAIAVLRALFDNLLDLSRFDAGEVKPVLRVVPLRDLLAPAVLETEVLCHARGLSFHSEIADAWVSTDPDLLRRVASNLLSNAVRYTPEGGVMLASWASEGFVTIEIRDTGIGIAPEDQARVFEEFVQLGNPGRDREKGVGLGLSIVKRICDLLGTPVAMRSVPGRGTSFTLRIPLAEAPSAGATAAVDHPSDPEVLRGTRVWVVEDDPMVRDALALQFASWGVAHAFARTIAELEAHRAAEGDWPDALLVDDMLGGEESGLDIATWLKDRMESRRIVLVTGNVDAQRLEALEASGLEVLRKPLSSADLARCLAKAMGASAVSVTWVDPAARPGPARAPAG